MIFLDFNATSCLCPEGRELMHQLNTQPLNPSSVHYFGRKGKSLLTKARSEFALMLGIKARLNEYDITFTSSGTEANNLILNNYRSNDVFISAIEHPSISVLAQTLPNHFIVPVDSKGIVKLHILDELLSKSKNDRKLVSIMLANHETGAIQPIQEIAKIVHKHGGQLHSDIAQAIGKMHVDLVDLEIDFATISGHKFGGALGCGALVSKTPHNLQPILYGGGQERSLRAGTENVIAIAATGVAALKVHTTLEARIKSLKDIRDSFELELRKRVRNVLVVCDEVERVPNTSAIVVHGKSSELMIIALDLKGFAIGSGAACSSGKMTGSSVLRAMGYDDKSSNSLLRVSFGVETTKEEIAAFLDTLEKVI